MMKYLFVLIFVIHLAIINDYGFTWDYHFHFFGGGKLLGYEPSQLEPRNLPFVEPDPRHAWTLPYGPLMSIPPVVSYLLFYKTLQLLPADSAYHLPIVLWGIAGIGIVYLFIKQAINKRVALFSALFLALTPRYFGDMHNNMKDIPSAVIFALNMWLIWRLITYKRVNDVLLAAAGFALAFNVKINSIFIPAIFFTWIILQKQYKKLYFYYFLLAPLFAFILWSVFWADPVGQLKHAWSTFGIGTNNIEVLLNGQWYCSGSTVPWYYPFWYVAITTPLPILIFFFIGLFTQHKKSLFVLWLLVPLTRYLVPTTGVIDGIRHFEEVLFPIAIIAGLGLEMISKKIRIFAFLLTMIYLLFTIFSYHPYQITYFNELVGGARGAFGKYDLDYWGTSQKKAVQWVNEHAPQNAKIHIVMAAAVAGQYLRPDLLENLNKHSYENSDYVILLNRQSFLYRFFYAHEYVLRNKPIHTIDINGAPLTWIYDNKQKTERHVPFWKDEDPCIRKYW